MNGNFYEQLQKIMSGTLKCDDYNLKLCYLKYCHRDIPEKQALVDEVAATSTNDPLILSTAQRIQIELDTMLKFVAYCKDVRGIEMNYPTRTPLYTKYKEREVYAASLEDFLERYTKPSRHAERGEEYVQCRIQSHKEDLEKFGYTTITHHDSKTGETVAWFGNKEDTQK